MGSNDSPVAIAGSGSSITEDSPGNITLSATDIDIGDNLTYTLVSQPSYGNVSISNNQILFTPFDNLSSGSSFSDNFTFECKRLGECDGHGSRHADGCGEQRQSGCNRR